MAFIYIYRINGAGRQNDKLFIDLLNKVRDGNIYDDVEKLLKERFIHQSDKTVQKMPCTCMLRMNQL